jgi:hypothetical protein
MKLIISDDDRDDDKQGSYSGRSASSQVAPHRELRVLYREVTRPSENMEIWHSGKYMYRLL